MALFGPSGRRVGRFSGRLRLERPGGTLRLLGPALNGVSDGRYRGVIEVRPNGGLDAINVLSVDDYTRGVVAGEMPSSWPMEALKAQAVTARTLRPGHAQARAARSTSIRTLARRCTAA